MENDQSDIQGCLHALKNGKVILYPTDTIWGLGCDPFIESAVDRIYHLKQRPKEKSMILLVDSLEMLGKYVGDISPETLRVMHLESKPLTIIFEPVENLPSWIVPQEGSVAFRITRDAFCKELIRQFGKPLVSTSANLSGQTAPGNFAGIAAEIIRGADYVVKYKQDETALASPSRIIAVEKDGTIRVIRD